MSIFNELAERALRLQQQPEDVIEAEHLAADAALQLKAAIDTGRIKIRDSDGADMSFSFPVDVPHEDPRVTREKWAMVWTAFYQIMVKLLKLPNQVRVNEWHPMEHNRGVGAVGSISWFASLEGTAKLCRWLAQEESDHEWTVAKVCESTKMSNSSLGRWRKLAKVKGPERGKSNFTFPPADLKKLLQHIVKKCPTESTVDKCEALLRRLPA